MTKREFLYDHDIDSIVDLINREIDYKNAQYDEEYQSQYQPQDEPVPARNIL